MVIDIVAGFAADIGLSAIKDKLSDIHCELQIKNDIKKFAERQFTDNYRYLPFDSEIDFDGLQEYLNDNLPNGLKTYLFTIDHNERVKCLERILNVSYLYANANNNIQKKTISDFITVTLNIAKEYYLDKIDGKYKLLLNITAENILEAIDNIPKQTVDLVVEKLEEIILSATVQASSHYRNTYPKILTEKAPLPPVEFYGRTDEISKIIENLKSKNKIVLVNGIGGVGKSAICKKLYHFFLKQESVPLAWVVYKGNNLKEDFVNQFYYPEGISKRDEKEKSIISLIQNTIDEDAIIFVDNLNITEKEEPFINTLANANCRVICNSRVTRFSYYQTINIELFNETDSVNLFKRYYPCDQNKSNDDLIKEIVNRASYHTLVVEVIAKIAKIENLTLHELLDSLIQKGFELNGLVEVDLTEKTLIGHLCRIFNVKKLTLNQKYILSNLAILSSQQIPKDFDKWIGLQNRSNISYLIKYAWFTESNDGYYMHPIIREVVKRICYIEYKELCNLIKQLIKLTDFNPTREAKHMNQFLPFIESILKKFKRERDKDVASLYYNISVIYWEKCQYTKAYKCVQECIYIREGLSSQDLEDLGCAYNHKAVICHSQKKFKRAILFYKKAYDIRKELPNKRLYAQTCSNLSLTYQRMYIQHVEDENYSRQEARKFLFIALGYQSESNKVFEEIFKSKKHPNLASAYNNTGELHRLLSNYKSSIEFFDKAKDIREEVLPPHHLDLDITYFYLGRVYLEYYDSENTKDLLYKALQYYEKSYYIRKFNSDKINAYKLSLTQQLEREFK